MFRKLIIPQAEIDKNTQTRDQIIHFFALFAFSSSQAEIKYITQLKIKANTATTATIWINSHIKFTVNLATILFDIFGVPGFFISLSTQPGNQIQFTSGTLDQ